MKIATSLIALGITAALSGVSQSSFAAQEKEIDSAFQWGRWAVLSPAAGNPEYQGVALDSAGNADRDDILPNSGGTGGGGGQPPVAINGFCDAGSSCGYATNDVIEGLAEQTVDGPVLAKFSLETSTGSDSSPSQNAQIAAISGNQGSFSVTETGDVDFPDIQSVDLNEDSEGFWKGAGAPQTTSAVLNGAGSRIDTTTTESSGIQEVNADSYEGVDTGYWDHSVQTSEQFVSSDEDLEGVVIPPQLSFQQNGGFFAHGVTATVDQMQSFTAGNATAVYQGKVLGFGSAVTLQFNFGNDSFLGNFADGNGFNGFEIDGSVQGVNFVATDGANGVTGSFFNEGLNASGAVNNATQLGVFSTDFTP